MDESHDSRHNSTYTLTQAPLGKKKKWVIFVKTNKKNTHNICFLKKIWDPLKFCFVAFRGRNGLILGEGSPPPTLYFLVVFVQQCECDSTCLWLDCASLILAAAPRMKIEGLQLFTLQSQSNILVGFELRSVASNHPAERSSMLRRDFVFPCVKCFNKLTLCPYNFSGFIVRIQHLILTKASDPGGLGWSGIGTGNPQI